MIGPKEGVPAQAFTLRNTSGKDIKFSGWKLAEVDSYNPNAVDRNTRFVTGSPRWKERAVYQTESGKIVCHRLGRSKVPGEVDRGEVLVIDVPTRSALAAARANVGSPYQQAGGVEEEVANFFAGDSLAKDLLEELKIEDVETID